MTMATQTHRRRWTGVAALAAAVLLLAGQAQALPIFARRYDFECSQCHTIAPQLNRFGWEFQEAGYRIPGDIGTYAAQPEVRRIPNPDAASVSGTAAGDTNTAQSEAAKPKDRGNDEVIPPFNLGDLLDARYTVSDSVDSKFNAAPGAAHSQSTTNTLSEGTLTLNVLTGAFNKYFGSFIEANLNADNPSSYSDIGIAFLSGVYGNKDGWAHVRVGYFGGAFGYGAADRAVGDGLTSKLSPQNPTADFTGAGVGYSGITADAIEVGYYSRLLGTELTLRWNQGGFWESPDGVSTYKPAAGAAPTASLVDPGKVVGSFSGTYLAKNTSDDPGLNPTAGNTGDELLSLTQFIGEENAVSAVFYNGNVAAMDPYNKATPFFGLTDHYDRMAGYGNVWLLPESVNLLGGFGYQMDMPSNETWTVGHTTYNFAPLNSWAAFGEVDWHADDYLAFFLHYDYSQPDNSAFFDIVQYEDLGLSWMAIPGLGGGLIVKADVKHTETQAGPNAAKTQCLGVTSDNALGSSIEYIW